MSIRNTTHINKKLLEYDNTTKEALEALHTHINKRAEGKTISMNQIIRASIQAYYTTITSRGVL